MNFKHTLFILIFAALAPRAAGMSGSTQTDYQEALMRQLQASGAAIRLGFSELTAEQRAVTARLHRAIASRDVKVVQEALQDENVDHGPFFYDLVAISPLRRALRVKHLGEERREMGYTEDDVAIVKALLDSGKESVNDTTTDLSALGGVVDRLITHLNLLHPGLSSAQRGLLQLLLQYGADPGIKESLSGYRNLNVYQQLQSALIRYHTFKERRDIFLRGLERLIREGRAEYLKQLKLQLEEESKVISEMTGFPAGVTRIVAALSSGDGIPHVLDELHAREVERVVLAESKKIENDLAALRQNAPQAEALEVVHKASEGRVITRGRRGLDVQGQETKRQAAQEQKAEVAQIREQAAAYVPKAKEDPISTLKDALLSVLSAERHEREGLVISGDLIAFNAMEPQKKETLLHYFVRQLIARRNGLASRDFEFQDDLTSDEADVLQWLISRGLSPDALDADGKTVYDLLVPQPKGDKARDERERLFLQKIEDIIGKQGKRLFGDCRFGEDDINLTKMAVERPQVKGRRRMPIQEQETKRQSAAIERKVTVAQQAEPTIGRAPVLTTEQQAATERLHKAIESRDVKSVQEALQDGADCLGAYVTSAFPETALKAALRPKSVGGPMRDLGYTQEDVAIVKALLSTGKIQVNAVSRGSSELAPFVLDLVRQLNDTAPAISQPQVRLLHLLLQYGADPEVSGPATGRGNVYDIIRDAQRPPDELRRFFLRGLEGLIRRGRAHYLELIKEQGAEQASFGLDEQRAARLERTLLLRSQVINESARDFARRNHAPELQRQPAALEQTGSGAEQADNDPMDIDWQASQE